jgi:hypothetical protein
MNQYVYVRPRDDGQGWAVDVYDGRRAWAKTHLGERTFNKAEAHRVAHKLRDPKFYSVRTKRAVNSSATDEALGLSVPFCSCGRRLTECDGSRAGCTGQTGMPGVRDTKNPCDMFSPGKPTNGGCQGDGHYLCRECGLFDERSEP